MLRLVTLVAVFLCLGISAHFAWAQDLSPNASFIRFTDSQAALPKNLPLASLSGASLCFVGDAVEAQAELVQMFGTPLQTELGIDGFRVVWANEVLVLKRCGSF